MTCDKCGAELVEQRMPARLRWEGRWVPEGERTTWVHRFGTKCEEA